MSSKQSSPPPAAADHLERAVDAISHGILEGADGAAFIAHALTAAAAELGGIERLTSPNSNSREALLIKLLVEGTPPPPSVGTPEVGSRPVEVLACVSKDMVQMSVDELYDDGATFVSASIAAQRGIEERSAEYAEVDRWVYGLIDTLREREYTEYACRFEAHVLAAGRQLVPDAFVCVRFVERFAGPGQPDLVGEQQPGTLERLLWEIGRSRTPLPGTTEAPVFNGLEPPGAVLRAAGNWPHLRIIELAGYGQP